MNPTTQQPTVYNQGQTFYSPQTGQAQGTVQFNANTGQRLGAGQSFALTPALQQAAARASTQPVNGARLGSTTPPIVPPPVQSTNAQNNLQTVVDTTFTGSQVQNKDGSVSTTFSDGTTNVPLTPENQRTGFAQQLKDLFAKQGTKAARTNEIQQEEGVQAKQDAVRKLENQALALDNSFNKRTMSLLGEGGMTREQAAPQLAELQRMQNSQKADLAIQHQVAQGDYESAFRIAQAKVDAEFEPLQSQLDSLKQQIDLFQNDMTESEKVKAQQAFQEKQSALDFARQKELLRYKASIDAASGLGGAVSSLTQSVIDNPSLFYNFTPTQKAQIIKELQSGGYDISRLQNAKLTAGQQDDVAQMTTVSGLIDKVLGLQNAEGKIPGIGAFGLGSLKQLGSQLNIGSMEGRTAQQTIGNIRGTIAKLRGGTSFTVNEEKLLNTYTPSINDSSAVIATKLANLKDFIQRKNIDLLSAAGSNITSGQITKKSDTKSTDLRSKYGY